MNLAMQIISTDKTVKNDTIEDLKDFNSITFNKSQKRRTTRFYDACY